MMYIYLAQINDICTLIRILKQPGLHKLSFYIVEATLLDNYVCDNFIFITIFK